jgi:hypothetical protein
MIIWKIGACNLSTTRQKVGVDWCQTIGGQLWNGKKMVGYWLTSIGNSLLLNQRLSSTRSMKPIKHALCTLIIWLGKVKHQGKTNQSPQHVDGWD